jgi:hypothetical protein
MMNPTLVAPSAEFFITWFKERDAQNAQLALLVV